MTDWGHRQLFTGPSRLRVQSLVLSGQDSVYTDSPGSFMMRCSKRATARISYTKTIDYYGIIVKITSIADQGRRICHIRAYRAAGKANTFAPICENVSQFPTSTRNRAVSLPRYCQMRLPWILYTTGLRLPISSRSDLIISNQGIHRPGSIFYGGERGNPGVPEDARNDLIGMV